MRYPHIFRRIAGLLLLPAALLILGAWEGPSRSGEGCCPGDGSPLGGGDSACLYSLICPAGAEDHACLMGASCSWEAEGGFCPGSLAAPDSAGSGLCPGFGAAATDDVRCSDADRGRCSELLDALRPMRAMRSDSLLVEAARLMLGTPYVAGTLEGAPEQLAVALCRSDCILLVEACAALVSTVKGEDCSFEAFVGNLRSMRYRNGVVDGYPSRLHYTSEWALQAGRLGILEEVTASLGGIPLKQDFSFMSTHPGSYPALKNDPGAVSAIREAERALARNTYYYIPKSKLSPLQSRIRHGDILCFTSSTAGLDIAHLGIAVRENGKLKFIHASSVAGKVVVEPSAPAGYLASKKGMSGLRVLRMI